VLTYRNLTAADVSECQKIWLELSGHYDHPIGGQWTPEKIAAEMADHPGVAVVSSCGQIEAFCLYRQLASDCREIMLLLTRPRVHRTGAMKALLRSFMEDLGAGESVWLEVHAGNLPAIALYEAMSFRLCGERPDYYADGGKALLYEYKPLQ
jgi:RimJ/RimL family protein N-acetyltransferase